jgi:hypothetical protein
LTSRRPASSGRAAIRHAVVEPPRRRRKGQRPADEELSDRPRWGADGVEQVVTSGGPPLRPEAEHYRVSAPVSSASTMPTSSRC